MNQYFGDLLSRTGSMHTKHIFSLHLNLLQNRHALSVTGKIEI